MIKNPILGSIAGDMIGVPYEFLRYGVAIAPTFPLWSEKSTFSDDSVMTLAVAKWLIEDDSFSIQHLIDCMVTLGRKYRNRGYGSNFGAWLDSKYPQPYNSYGNGSAMRVSPIGCLNGSDMAIDTLAIESASVSHNHPEGINGARAITDFIFYIREGKHDLNWIKELVEKTYGYDLSRTPQQIRDAGYKFEVSCQKSVPEAICCFLNSNSYEETIREAILLRGDTDTQACIAGGIAAAYWGMPEEIAEEAKSRLPQDLYVILSKFSKKYNLPL
jgi:ADP-ribosylglycohydrolase